jgi:hypothetical protein
VTAGRADIALLHTAAVHVATFDRLFAEMAPGLRIAHEVRPELLAAAEHAGGATEDVLNDAALALSAHARNTGAPVNMCTCTTIADAADRAAQELGQPVLRVDCALAETAFAAGPRVLIAACVQTTLAPTEALFRRIAAVARPDAEIRLLLLEDAWPLFHAGDIAGYAERIAAGIRAEVARDPVDAVALAQASMAPAEPLLADLGHPVFSSPEPAVRAALAALGRA